MDKLARLLAPLAWGVSRPSRATTTRSRPPTTSRRRSAAERIGFGGRFGLSVSKVYVGVSVIDYLGGSDVNLSDQALLFGLELGYGIVLRFDTQVTLVLRPLLGEPDVVTTASGRTVVGGMPSATTTIGSSPASATAPTRRRGSRTERG